MLDALVFAKTPGWMKKVYPECVWSLNTQEKVLFLTFDDGPIPEVTEFVLDTLKQYNAKATFFCIGNNIALHPQIFEAVVQQGHTIGNHTYDHVNGWKTEVPTYISNMEKCQALHAFSYFRPPYGKLTPAQYKILKAKSKIVMWDVLSFDFKPEISAEAVAQIVIKNAVAGSIVVFHDSVKAYPKILTALPAVLSHFTALGYRFEALPSTPWN